MAKAKKPAVMVSKFLRDAVNARLDDPAAGIKLPTLLECLLPVYEGNKLVRAQGKLTIVPEGAHWRVKLDCPTEIISTSMAVDSLVDMFEQFEAHLASGKAVWSPGWKKSGRQLPTVDDLI
jgi:hypothetical protein